MSLVLTDPQSTVDAITSFLTDVFYTAGLQTGVIAISGGIDSALSLTLLVKALGANSMVPVLLPYHDQDMTDAQEICRWNGIPKEKWIMRNIGDHVDALAQSVNASEPLRRGNIMARVRMIMIYDTAKAMNALVCGTENKSEKYLGYFTRFGDEASDIEPIQHLYKTQIRQLCRHLGIPEQIITKPPSAGLWQGQTDEDEMGFTYEQADRVMAKYIDEDEVVENIIIDGIDHGIVNKVIATIHAAHFKHEVPYRLEE